jgi:hypothetical protein
VGGGYPDDGLAYVTLQWIMDEAHLVGARFLWAHRNEVDTRVDSHARLYDSRAGLAGYYRYGPRSVDDLCNDPEHGVNVAKPLVHSAAWERITVRQTAYAPTSFPTSYLLADYPAGGGPLRALRMTPSLETQPDVAGRNHDMELARNAIWRRRFAYFATVFSSAILVLFPVFDWTGGLSFWTDQWLAPLSGALSWAVEEKFVPWAAPWLRSFAAHPTLFLLFAALLLWLFVRKSQLLQSEIFRFAEYAWRRV